MTPSQLLPTRKRHKPNTSSPLSLPTRHFQVSCVDQKLVQLLDPGMELSHSHCWWSWMAIFLAPSYIGKGNHLQYVWRDRVAQALRKFSFHPSCECIQSRTSKPKSVSLYVSVLHGQRWLLRDPRCQKLQLLKSKNSSHLEENSNPSRKSRVQRTCTAGLSLRFQVCICAFL